MAVLMGNEGRALLVRQQEADELAAPPADGVEHRYRSTQALEEIPNIGEPSADEAPEPMSRPARIGLLALVALAFAGAAVIGLARLAQWMGKA